MFKLKH